MVDPYCASNAARSPWATTARVAAANRLPRTASTANADQLTRFRMIQAAPSQAVHTPAPTPSTAGIRVTPNPKRPNTRPANARALDSRSAKSTLAATRKATSDSFNKGADHHTTVGVIATNHAV